VSPPIPFRAGGRDRSGLDCWGLVRLVYAEQCGVELPAYSGLYADVSDQVAVRAIFETERGEWVEVAAPEPLDAIWCRIAGHECHVALSVVPGLMLHALLGHGTRTERIPSPAWQRRTIGYYRHSSRV